MVSAATAGLSRSGSANTISKAITTAPSAVSLSIRSATRVRGQGHWPSFARLFSSMSMMVTGLAVFTRGSMTWKPSKVLTLSSSTAKGSATRSAANPIRIARQTSLAIPNLRLNQRRNTLSRFIPFGYHIRGLRHQMPLLSGHCACFPADVMIALTK